MTSFGNRSARWLMLGAALSLAACGGGDGGATAVAVAPPPAPPPAVVAPPANDQCSLRNRQLWAQGVMNEWYLFPETLPASLDPAPFATVQDYIDALTATARGQRRDRFFTNITSIAQESAFFAAGTSIGFGFRIGANSAQRQAGIIETFEGTPAFAAGIDRGTEILAIGSSPANLRTVSDIIATEGTAGVTNALGPNSVGVARTLRVSGPGGVRTVDLVKTEFNLIAVSNRYGALTLNDGARRIGYLNLRTYISSADDQLRTAFANFRAAGITDFIIDLRYNGGGLVSTANLMGDLLGGNRFTSDVFSNTTFRPEKASNNVIKRFAPTAQSVSPVRIAFIGTPSTASASELTMNAFIPFFGSNVALVGSNTFGKPVGQVAIDRAACDDRLRVTAFSVRNSANSDAYYDGLKSAFAVTCAAGDDVSRPLGDPNEASVRAAINFLAGRACGAPIAAAEQRAQQASGAALELLTPDAPSTAQRETPGFF